MQQHRAKLSSYPHDFAYLRRLRFGPMDTFTHLLLARIQLHRAGYLMGGP